MSRQSSYPGRTPLMTAVIEQDVNCIAALIESGADIEARDKHGQNVLYHAFPDVFTPKAMEVLELLLSRGINVNASLDGDGCSALVTAIIMDLPQVVKLLVNNMVDVDESAASKFWACLTSDPATQRNKLAKSYASTEFIFSKGCGHAVTPLMSSVLYKRTDIFYILLDSMASPQALSFGTFWRASISSVCSTCDVQITPLHMAAYLGDLEICYVLIHQKHPFPERDLNFNCRSSATEISPLWFALLQGHEKIVKLFLSFGKPEAFPCHFGSGLQVCLEEGHPASALMILRAGYDLSDDMDWIEDEKYQTTNREVIEKIESLVNQPRPLLDWCGSVLRAKFGLKLDTYLNKVGAPNKVYDILNFNDLTRSAWQPEVREIQIAGKVGLAETNFVLL